MAKTRRWKPDPENRYRSRVFGLVPGPWRECYRRAMTGVDGRALTALFRGHKSGWSAKPPEFA